MEPEAPAASKRGRARGVRRRGLTVVVLTDVVGASAVLSAAPIGWLSQDYGTAGRNRLSLTGSTASSAGVPLALLALAGLAAALATSGWLRRAIGGLIGIAALVVGETAISVVVSPPASAQSPDLGLPAPVSMMGPVVVHAFGPSLAVCGAILILASGGLIVAGVGARRLAGRFDTPAAQRQRATSGQGGSLTADDSATDWWKALDVGHDPTGPPSDD